MTEKMSTGIPGLDQVLLGGIPTDVICVIMGAPGTGKTILAEQIAFHNSTEENPALYLTTLSEPLEKFISHGQSYNFFDPDKVGVSVFYEDLGSILRERGAKALAEVVMDLLLKHRPRLIFIDSFKALNELFESAYEQRTVLYDLATTLSAYKSTTFLIGEYAQDMTTDLPEFAIADVVLNLMKLTTNVREQRFLRVEKLRASDSIAGMHAFKITQNGIEVYPRLLTPRLTPTYRPKVERVNTGVAGLDEMVEKGFWRGSTTLLAGPSGSGKTVLALHFLRAGFLSGEPSLYVTFQENPAQLARLMLNLGWNPEEMLESPLVEMMYRSPVEMQLDSVASEIFEHIREKRVRRVVIDAIGDLQRSSIDEHRFANFIYALTQWFAVENVTCIITCEIRDLFEIHALTETAISNLSDNIVLLGFSKTPEMERTVRIIKTRGSAHDNRLHILEISDEGAKVSR